MTTIATDGKTLAGDSQITDHGTIHSKSFTKVYRLNDGSVFGFTGSPFYVCHWLDFLNGTISELNCSDGSEALVLRPDGRVFCFNQIGRCYEQSVPTAVGSGAAYALGAMLAGADSRWAVSIAAALNTGTGGQIVSLSIEDEEEKAASEQTIEHPEEDLDDNEGWIPHDGSRLPPTSYVGPIDIKYSGGSVRLGMDSSYVLWGNIARFPLANVTHYRIPSRAQPKNPATI